MSTPRPAEAIGTHAGYVATVAHEDFGEVTAHLKLLSRKRIANELLCASMAECFGALTPRCFVLELDERLPDAQHHYRNTGYCFASVRVPHARTLDQLATLANPSQTEDFFHSGQWQSIVAFDAFVANSDRTAANMLLDHRGVVWVIDHETAFGGDWEPMDLLPLRHVTNLLARPGQKHPTFEMRSRLIEEWMERQAPLSVRDLSASLPPVGLLTDGELRALSLYLQQRWRGFGEVLRCALFSQH